MSQDFQFVDADVHMLPPSYAVYMPVTDSSGNNNVVLVVPVLVKPTPTALDQHHFDVFVPPVFVTRGKTYINWCLVLLSQEPSARFEFPSQNGVVIHWSVDAPDEVSKRQVSKTQFEIHIDTGQYVARVIDPYELDIVLQLLGSPDPAIRIKAKVDPSVSVLPDPVEIPTWP